MSETVIVPPASGIRRPRGPFIPPLLVVPFLIYNGVAYLLFGGRPEGWSTGHVFTVNMVSGVPWTLTSGDLLLVVGLVCLFFELLKSTNTGRSSLVEHMLSTALLIVFIVEFILAGAAASSTFFLLMVMSLVDVVAGFSISITGAGRDVTME